MSPFLSRGCLYPKQQNKEKRNGDLMHDSTLRLKLNLGIFHKGPINELEPNLPILATFMFPIF
ncbi:hypothetical protein ATG66_2358 [Vibrio sp. ES.051]|nr:hypothetical protein ATG66_2358 [Vibrio sp. ES.051]